MSERLAILAEGLFESHHGKTAHGVIRYGAREVAAVIDSSCAGRTASEVIPFCARPVPIVASLGEALRHDPTTLLLGVAPTGRWLDPAWRTLLLEALGAGLDVEAGLHHQLADDAELREAAAANGAGLRDLRAVPRDLGVPRGPNSRDPSVRVIHSVGSDTVIGKKVVTLELDLEARRRGLRSVYVPTGQTGVAIAGWGIAVDHVISDYVAGAADDSSTRAPSAATCSSSRGRGRSFTPPTPGSRSACSTAAHPTSSCSSTALAPPRSATTRTCRCRRCPS